MSKEKIESRRAFMKMLGKAAGTVAGAAAFMAVAKTVEAAPSEDRPTTYCGVGSCSGGCFGRCTGTCKGGCEGCSSTCRGTCDNTCSGSCDRSSR